MRDLDREIFKIILLTSRNQIILEKTLFEGSLSESLVNPREIVKEALNHAAAAVIFSHNHPSGDPSPSSEDKRITSRLKQACELIGIRVLDHVVIGKIHKKPDPPDAVSLLQIDRLNIVLHFGQALLF